MSRLTAILVLVNTVTGVLVAPALYIAYMSGYCLRSPEIVGTITYGLLNDMSVCGYIHTVVSPILLLALVAAHGLSTAMTVFKKLETGRLGLVAGYAYLSFIVLVVTHMLLAFIYG